MKPHGDIMHPPRVSPRLSVVSLALVLFPVTGVLGKNLEIPAEKVRSAGDLSDILGAPPEAPDAPAGFSWKSYGGELNLTTNVLFPLEGQEVPPVFEVMPEISATPLGAFQSRYQEWGYHCVEIDFEPPACWPVFGTEQQPLPRFAGVKPGPHTLRVALTDASGQWIVPSSWSKLRRFVVVDPGESTQVATTDDDDGKEKEDDDDKADDPEPDIRLAVPIVRIVGPPEMSILTSRFLDLTYEVRLIRLRLLLLVLFASMQLVFFSTM